MMNTFDQIKQQAQEDKIPSMLEEGRFYCEHLIQSQHLNSMLEIGTGVGIWSIHMALANPQIKITTIERDPLRAQKATENFKACGLLDRITLINEDALLTKISGSFDFILIDGPKGQNKALVTKVLPLLNPNGYLLIDNLDFHGETTIESRNQSRDLKQLVRKINDFKDWANRQSDLTVKELPFGDGLMLISRKYPQ